MRPRHPNFKRQVKGACISAVLLLPVLVVGCSTGSDFGSSRSRPGSGDSPASGGTVAVTMAGLEFSPAAIHAKVGDRVMWTNRDAAPHNVTYVSGPAFTSSPRALHRGKTFAIALTQAGTIHYFCTIHPWMKATIIVSR